MATTQAQRPLQLKVASLGPDVLMGTGFNGQEAVSQLFWSQIECISEQPEQVKLNQLLGQKATLTLRLAEGQRYFSGVISRCAHAGRDVGANARFTRYRLEVVPWLWLLTRTTDSRIFQDKSVPDIVEKIFSDHGMKDYRLALANTYTPIDYYVQYRETDFNFVSRLMEEEGIFYFFEHRDGAHTLVLADSPDAHKPGPGSSQIRFEPEGGPGEREDTVTAWLEQQELRPGKLTLWDNNFQMPTKNLESALPSKIKAGGNDAWEVYDFPGGYAHRFNKPDERMGEVESAGRKLAKTRMEEEEAQHLIITGVSSVRGFTAGCRFDLVSPPPGITGGPYVLTSVQHTARQGDYVSDEEEFRYSNSFVCIPHEVPFRPRRSTPQPVVEGSHTATVVGPPGEEIYPDKYGRVKVQFHWDREGQRNEHSSCWVRVSQLHAGQSFGGISIPRIGEEVVVDFLEGDPNQPIVIGRVYHAQNMPPFPLPAQMNISGMKSNSTKGGGGYNEYVMDDTKGNELIREHGQYDKDSTIEHDLREHVLHDRSRDVTNNETIQIGNNRTETVGHNESLTVGNNRTETIGVNETLAVGANRSRTVGANETVTVAVMRTHTVGTNEAITVGAMREVTVGAGQVIMVGANQSIMVGRNETETIGGNLKETVGKKHSNQVGTDRDTKIGKNDTLKVGKKLNVDAGDEITLKTGMSSITMKKDGTIAIKGKQITIDAMQKIQEKALQISSEAQTKHEIKGALVTVEASGINTIKGALVKIN